MALRQFITSRSVEVIVRRELSKPSYGSGYRIGGRLVLTAAHLLDAVGSDCKVRDKQSFGEENAQVVWTAQEGLDIALIELPESVKAVESVTFGNLPESETGERIKFQMYGYPRKDWVEQKEGPAASGHQSEGTIYLSDTAPDDLLVLRIDEPVAPESLIASAIAEIKEDSREPKSEWQGMSGAAVVCDGLVVAVQTRHSRPMQPNRVDATPLRTVFDDEQWRQLLEKHGINSEPEIAHLSGRSISPPFQVTAPPTYYVNRLEIAQSLKNQLLQPKDELSILVISEAYGLGGIGKSTLAKALAHDPDIRAHFPDGILWATLGQDPEEQTLLPELGKWIQALGDHNFPVTTNAIKSSASEHLRRLLADKAVLLIVDDVWNSNELRLFTVGGSHCEVLVTTRYTSIAEDLRKDFQVKDYLLPEMSQIQSMQLITAQLKQQFNRDLQEGERDPAASLAQAVHHLPLALELAVAQVADGTYSWNRLLQDIQKEVARLKSFDLPGARDAQTEVDRKRYSLVASLNLSIRCLSDYSREHFTWLGVLPEDALICPKMVATLWEMDEEDAEDELRYLRSKALLLPDTSIADGVLAYRIHDLFHDLTRNLITAASHPKKSGDLPGLGLKMEDAQQYLLRLYRKKTRNQQWHTLPFDGHIQDRLVWHMQRAGWTEEIHNLLSETAESGQNAWYETREQLGQTAGYISDVRQAWAFTDQEAAKNNLSSETIGLQCRYALIIASLNSISNIPEELLIALAKKQIWTLDQALAYARQLIDPSHKAISLALLAEDLPVQAKCEIACEVLITVQSIQDECDREHALIAISAKLPKQLLPQALEIAQEIEEESYRASALVSLFQNLPKELVSQALETALEIQNDYCRSKTLAALASQLSLDQLRLALTDVQSMKYANHRFMFLLVCAEELPEVLPQALAAAQAIENEELRSNALVALANRLPPKLSSQALQAVQSLKNEQYKVDVITALVNQLTSDSLEQARVISQEIEHPYYRFLALLSLTNHFSELLPQALVAARDVQDEELLSKILIALGKQVPQLLPSILEALKELFENEPYKAEVLSTLVDNLPPNLLIQALTIAQEIKYPYARFTALLGLTNNLPDVWYQVWIALQEIKEERLISDALIASSHCLPLSFFPEALQIIQAFEDKAYMNKSLAALATRLPQELLRQALMIAQTLDDKHSRLAALLAFADRRQEVWFNSLDLAKTARYERDRYNTLAVIVNHLPPTNHLPISLFSQALSITQSIENERSRLEIVEALFNKLPSELLAQALTIALSFGNKEYCAKALVNLLDRLPEDLLAEVYKAAQFFGDEECFSRVTAGLVGNFPQVFSLVLKKVQDIKSKYSRSQVLITLAQRLPQQLISMALTEARELKDKGDRSCFLASLGQKLSATQAIELAQEIEDDYYISELLIVVIPKLSKILLPQVLELAQRIQDKNYKAKVLVALVDKLPETVPLALKTIQSIEIEYYRAEVLVSLVSKLSDDMLSSAQTIAQTIKDRAFQARALAAIATKLPEIWPQVLEAASHEYEDEPRRTSSVMPFFADSLPHSYWPQALQASVVNRHESNVATTLAALAEKIPPEFLFQVLESAQTLEDKGHRVRVFKALFPQFSQLPTGEICQNWLIIIHCLGCLNRFSALQCLASLKPMIEKVGGLEAVDITAHEIECVCEWWK
jgi:hypothetical protein